MAKKRPKPTKSQRVRAVARERLGSPKPGRLVEERATRDKSKHKKKIIEADD